MGKTTRKLQGIQFWHYVMLKKMKDNLKELKGEKR